MPCMTGDLHGLGAGAVPDRGTRYPRFAIRASGISLQMKRRAAKSERKPSREAQPKSARPPTGKHANAELQKASRAPSRAIVMRVAAEVEALAAQLQPERARILNLEARVQA